MQRAVAEHPADHRPPGGGIALTAPHFDRMRLDKDGLSNLATDDECTRSARRAGLVENVLVTDVYGGTVTNLRSLGRPFYVYTYDWRQSPQRGAGRPRRPRRAGPARDRAAKVVIFSHSMGGLVTRWYIDDPARAARWRAR